MSKIYTKHGDKGQSSLVGGQRVRKDHPRLWAYGSVDELNSVIGVLLAFGSSRKSLTEDQQRSITSSLRRIQNELFQIGSVLACENQEMKIKFPSINETQVNILEKEIDIMESQLRPLKNFILPGGDLLAAQAHVARTVCRRAEREIFTVIADSEDEVDFLMLKYINRLSDYLFVLARWLNSITGTIDLPWISS